MTKTSAGYIVGTITGIVLTGAVVYNVVTSQLEKKINALKETIKQEKEISVKEKADYDIKLRLMAVQYGVKLSGMSPQSAITSAELVAYGRREKAWQAPAGQFWVSEKELLDIPIEEIISIAKEMDVGNDGLTEEDAARGIERLIPKKTPPLEVLQEEEHPKYLTVLSSEHLVFPKKKKD